MYISLLLPTKDTSLNYCVNELNKCIKNSAANSNSIFVVEHNNLVDHYGFLDPLLGRFKRSIPNPDDLIHLGPSGLKRFFRIFKDSILHKNSSPSNRRHNSSLPHSRTTETPDLTPHTPHVGRRPFTGVTPCPTWLPELPHLGFLRPPYQWRNVAPVAPASPGGGGGGGGRHEKGAPKFRSYLAAKMYHTSAKLTFSGGEKYLGVQKAPGGAKKAPGGARSL